MCPDVSYAAQIWYNKNKNKTLLKKFNFHQRSWTSRALRSFPQTATSDLTALCGLLPVNLQIENSVKAYNFKKEASNINSTISIEPHISYIDLPYPPTIFQPFEPQPFNEPDYSFYTDGSKTNDGVGAGFCIYEKTSTTPGVAKLFRR